MFLPSVEEVKAEKNQFRSFQSSAQIELLDLLPIAAQYIVLCNEIFISVEVPREKEIDT